VPCCDNFVWGPEEAVRNLYHDQSFADRILALTLSEAQMDVMLRNRFTVAHLRWQPCWFNPDLEKWLHRIKLPALVVWGDDDKIMPPANAALWRERLPDARLVMVSECGHLPLVEQASLVARHVREFLKGVAP
jgi:pimeloyl-ACP methyl ester carboxylesterase